jgi:hypothetical protein
MPDKLDLSELMSFDKSALQKAQTDEKNSLPTQAVIEEEKRQGGGSTDSTP